MAPPGETFRRGCSGRAFPTRPYSFGFVSARKTRPSIVTEGVNTLAAGEGMATRRPSPLMAGSRPPVPASFPLWREMRTVRGVQGAAPRHVSRTKTCSNAELLLPGVFCGVRSGVTETNATKRPAALIDGDRLSLRPG